MKAIPEVHLHQWSPAVRRTAAILVCAGALSVGVHSSLQGQDGLPRTFDENFYRRPYPQLVKRILLPAVRGLTFESEPNDNFMTANPIVLGDTVGGDINPAGDVDYYAIDLTVGERVDFDIDAFGVGSSSDPVLTLYDADGVTVLDISDNVVGLDPRIVYQPPTSGRLFVRVSDAVGGGGPTNFFYLLKATVVPTGPGDPTTFFALALGNPMGTAALPGGAFNVVDALNTRVLDVDAAGASSVLASLVTTGAGPQTDVARDLVVDGFGNLLVAGRQDITQAVVWRVTSTGDTTSYLLGNDVTSFFSAVTVDRQGDIWVADQRPGQMLIVHFDPLGQVVEVIDVTAAGTDLFDLAFSPGGELHFTNLFGDVYKIVNGAPVRVIQRSGFSEGLAFDVDGYLYLADGSVGKILLYDPAYTLVHDPFAGTNLAGPLNLVFGRDAGGATTSSLFALNFGLGLPPPFAGAMMAAAAGSTRAPGYPVSDFLMVTTDSLRSVPVGSPYADTLKVAGGAASWSILTGTLPPGLVLNGETGEILGEASVDGIFSFVVKADDGLRVGFADLAINTLTFQIPADDVANALFGFTTLPIEQSQFLDTQGNANGTLDIGDFRVYLQVIGQLPGGSSIVEPVPTGVPQ
jgi:hypothetical protein